jgi:hypothetical protein
MVGNPFDAVLALVQNSLESQVVDLRKSDSAHSEKRIQIDSALDLLIESARAEAKAARQLSLAAGAVELIMPLVPENSRGAAKDFQTALEVVRFHADLWDGLANNASAVRKNLEENIRVDRNQMLEIAESFITLLAEIRKSMPKQIGPTGREP